MNSRACLPSLGVEHPADIYYGMTYIVTPSQPKVKLEEPKDVTAPCTFKEIKQVSTSDP